MIMDLDYYKDTTKSLHFKHGIGAEALAHAILHIAHLVGMHRALAHFHAIGLVVVGVAKHPVVHIALCNKIFHCHDKSRREPIGGISGVFHLHGAMMRDHHLGFGFGSGVLG